MKKLLLAVCALFGFMACTQNPIEEQSAIRTDIPETIKVGFEDSETRIQLNEAQKTVWTKDDLVSVFYLSNANQKWQYQGETGERVGNLKRVENATATAQTSKVVVVYPYRDDHYLNYESCNLHATLPATQYYTKGSYGIGSNLMVSQSEFTQFSLKSVCGWLKLQLTGDGEVVKSIKFRGNNGEQVAGLIYVDTETAEATLASEMGSSDDNNAGGNLIFDDTILTEVTLDCGEGVELGAEATSFYIALPPQTFANGFTVEIESDGYKPMTLSTENALIIERNTIQPMASVEHNTECILSLRQIHYHSINGKIELDRWTFDTFGANIISHELNENSNLWIITFDDMVTSIGDGAFSGCRDLVYITIPEKVSRIGKNAFYSSNLASIYFWGNNVTTIGDNAFYWCSSLTSVTIPDSVTTIGGGAFSGCSSLTSVTIPDSVTTIGYYVFENCSNLTNVVCEATTPPTLGDYAFKGVPSIVITVSESVLDKYLSDSQWRQNCILSPADRSAYNVGDLITIDGVQGVVYFANDAAVRVVSVEETSCKYSLFNNYASASNEHYGAVNLATIKSKQGYIDNYPAFAWCEALGDGWYLPAKSELSLIESVKENINASLIANNLAVISGDYWSSTDNINDGSIAYVLDFSNEKWLYPFKNTTNKVRAVKVF